MKKVAVIFYSNAGNVEVLADKLSKSVEKEGGEVIFKHVQDAKVEDVLNADAVAFGSPSMDNNRVEQEFMAPFLKELKLLPNNNKKAILFGSYGWDDGKFMESFKETINDYGFNIVGTLAVKEAPTKEELNKIEELGKLLLK